MVLTTNTPKTIRILPLIFKKFHKFFAGQLSYFNSGNQIKPREMVRLRDKANVKRVVNIRNCGFHLGKIQLSCRPVGKIESHEKSLPILLGIQNVPFKSIQFQVLTNNTVWLSVDIEKRTIYLHFACSDTFETSSILSILDEIIILKMTPNINFFFFKKNTLDQRLTYIAPNYDIYLHYTFVQNLIHP